MRHSSFLPDLPFDLGTLVLSPGVMAALPGAPLLRRYIDEKLEFHLAGDFGIISRHTRCDNVTAALLGAGVLTSRFVMPGHICPPHRGMVISTHLEEQTTTIRFAGETE